MSGDDLIAYFEAIAERDPTAEPPPIPDLVDRTNLDRFFLMEQYKDAGVPIFRQPVEAWPVSRHRDFTTIMLARGRVQQMERAIASAWNDPKIKADPPEWRGMG